MEKSYYSQNGEDFLLWKIFGDKKDGYYVDIGAHDGIFFSNTYGFDLAGWSGICVEPHPFFYDLLKTSRPRATNLQIAVGIKDLPTVEFFASTKGAFSSLFKSSVQILDKRFPELGTRWKKITVPQYTINTMFSTYLPKDKDIDIFTLDIEGGELHAMMGIDLKKYRPRILIIEALDYLQKDITKNLCELMQKNGYFFAKNLHKNLFFCREKKDAGIISETKIQCKLVPPQMPKESF